MRHLLLSVFLLSSSAASAETIAGWDFEDMDLVVDTTTAANTNNTVIAGGGATHTGFVAGDGSAEAANFNDLDVADTRYIELAANTQGYTGVSFVFSARSSATASKWWKVEVSVDGGGFVALSPLFEMTGSSAFSDLDYPLPGADDAADVVVRIVPTDNAGEFVRAGDDLQAPSSAGTFRIDNVSFEGAPPGVDAGPPPEEDAGPPEMDAGPPPPDDAGPAGAPPIISEVAWFGTASSSSDEWIELYNPGPTIADLSRFVLVDDSAEPTPLPAVSMASGAVLVLEKTATTLSLSPPAAEVLDGFPTLSNSGSDYLRVCPEGDEDTLAACDVARPQGASWPAGDNGDDATMVRRRDDLDGSFPSSWTTYAGAPSSVTDADGTAINGSPGSFANEVLGVDAGPDFDSGPPPGPLDAGPNETPTVSLSSPSGSVTSAGEVAVVYSASDADGVDTVSVSLFYDTDGDGFDGVLIARGLPAGSDRSYSWQTTDTPGGAYRVFAVARDDRGEAAYAYAPGTVTIEGGGASAGGTITLVEPDGVDDAAVDGRYLISWEVDVPEGEDGLVSLFYDEDDAGLDGEPIIFGLPLLDAEGEPGPRAYAWAPGEEVAPGAYAIYATLEWRGGTVSDYSEFLQVGETGCACGATGDDSRVSGILGAGLVAAWLILRRRRGQRRRCA